MHITILRVPDNGKQWYSLVAFLCCPTWRSTVVLMVLPAISKCAKKCAKNVSWKKKRVEGLLWHCWVLIIRKGHVQI